MVYDERYNKYSDFSYGTSRFIIYLCWYGMWFSLYKVGNLVAVILCGGQ